MNEIIFKKTGKKNYADVAALYNYYVINSTATYHINTLKPREVINFFNIENPAVYAFCIYDRDDFCGFCLLRPYSSKEGYRFTYEITIYIKAEQTKKGIGTAAVEYMEKAAGEKGIKTIIAGICAENTGSIKLFEKCGYEKCGYFKNMGYKFDRVLDNVYYQKLL